MTIRYTESLYYDAADGFATAVRDGYRIDKAEVPIEPAREGLTADEAEDVAAQDPGLLTLVRE